MKALTVLIHSLIGWAFCAAIMGVGPQITSMGNTRIVHLIAGPAGFGLLSAFYHRKYNYTKPVVTALIFLAFVAAMDFFLVGFVISKSLDMFKSPIGTWLPFTLLFITIYTAGAVVNIKKDNSNI